MATTIDELEVKITANTDGLNKGIDSAKSKISKMQPSMNMGEMAKGIDNVKDKMGALGSTAKSNGGSITKAFFLANIATGVVTKAIGLISQNIGAAVSRLDTLNNYTKVMSNLGVNSSDAQASIKRLSDKLVGLPTTLDDAALAVQRFTSANGNVKASTEMFLALNNAILAGGADMQTQKSALEQLSQSYAKGSPDMMEWRSAMTAMPAQLKQVAQAMNFASANDLGEALRSGKVSMNDFMITLVNLNKTGIGGYKSLEEQARNSTGGIGTSFANLKNSITRGISSIIGAIGQVNISGFFQGITSSINAVIPYITGFVKALTWAFSFVGRLFGNKNKKAVDNANKGFKNVGVSAGGTMAKGMDKATGSAKKLRKELNGLASFDEMNVLTEAHSESGGGGSAAASAPVSVGGSLDGIDLSGFDQNLDSVNDKSAEIAEKIKSYFIGIGGIFKNIWDSAPVQSFLDFVTSAWNYIYNLVSSFAVNITGLMFDTFDAISGNVQSIIDSMSGLFSQVFSDLAATIQENGEAIIEGINGIVTRIWKDVIKPVVFIITKIVSDMYSIVKSLWDEYGKQTLDNVMKFIDTILKCCQSIWDNIINPIIKPIFSTLKDLWDKHIKGVIKTIGDFIMKLVNFVLEIYNKFVAPIVDFILQILKPEIAGISEFISGVVYSIFAVISDVVGSICKVFGGIIDFISGVFSGDWEKAWNGIVGIFEGIIDGLVGIIKAPINFIISGINGFIGMLNNIKIPKWVPGVGGKGINIPKIPKLATGGVVEKPTFAMVGEKGKEAVMPLERNTGWIDALASKLNTKGDNTGQPINLTVQVGEEKLIDTIIDGINTKTFELNGGVIRL